MAAPRIADFEKLQGIDEGVDLLLAVFFMEHNAEQAGSLRLLSRLIRY